MSKLIAIVCLALVTATTTAQTRHSHLRPSKAFWDFPERPRRALVHYTHLSKGRKLVDVGDSLYMLNRRNRVLWVWNTGGPPLYSPPFVDSSGTIYVTAYDLLWVAIDSTTGNERWVGTANGRASYSPIIPFKNDTYFVVTYMSAYRRTPDEIVNNHVTLCRGNSILWTSDIPPDARLRIRSGKVFLVTRHNRRTTLTPLAVPDKLDKPIGKVSALAPYD